MTKRILTLQVEITDELQSAWIWHNHMNSNPTYGVRVTVIQEGPIPEENEQIEKNDLN